MYSHLSHSFERPHKGKFSSSFNNAFKELTNLVSGHSHSPADAGQGESYPAHLKETIKLYQQLMKHVVPEAPTVSQTNYSMQQKIVGATAPVGQNTNANARNSVTATNAKNGVSTVTRVKGASAYAGNSTSGSSSSDSDEIANDGSGKKRKNKGRTNVKGLMDDHNESRSKMAEAVVNLTEAYGAKKGDGDELDFKKNVWQDQKEYKEKKLDVKYGYKNAKFDSEKKRAVLALIKEDRNTAIAQYKEETDVILKDMYKEELKTLGELYQQKLKEFAE